MMSSPPSEFHTGPRPSLGRDSVAGAAESRWSLQVCYVEMGERGMGKDGRW